MKRLALFSVIFNLLFVGSYAFAFSIIPDDLEIDFRSDIWAGASGQSTYTADGLTVISASGTLPQYQNYFLYQDSIDGLGITTIRLSDNSTVNDVDEIEKNEFLELFFNTGLWLTGAWITDLYDYEPGLQENFQHDEYGHLTINGVTTIDFGAFDNGQYPSGSGTPTNGELWIDFGGPILVNQIVFYPGSSTESWHDPRNEYSVAGLTTTSEVPEPGTLFLLGAGLIGFGMVRQRKRFS